MCRSVTCTICSKTTWAGCGQHIDQVMAVVPRADRCPGHSDAEKAAAGGGSFLRRLLHRS